MMFSRFGQVRRLISTQKIQLFLPYNILFSTDGPCGKKILKCLNEGVFQTSNCKCKCKDTETGKKCESKSIFYFLCRQRFKNLVSHSNAVILNPSFSLAFSRFLLTITTP